MEKVIIVEQINFVYKITLNRPDKANSFNREMSVALQKELDNAATNKNIRAVLLTGNGKAFSAGQDLAEATNVDAAGFDRIVREQYNPIIEKIRNLKKPVVCAVNGVAAGAGANIALACDITVAAASASFLQAFSKIGLIPDSSGTFFLPRLIGIQRAAALMMLAEKVSASDAYQMGMIYKVVEDAQFAEESLKIASQLSNMPTKGLALTKHLLNQSFDNSLAQQLDQERIAQIEAGQTYDHKEGVKAFLEKRVPVFKGE